MTLHTQYIEWYLDQSLGFGKPTGKNGIFGHSFHFDHLEEAKWLLTHTSHWMAI